MNNPSTNDVTGFRRSGVKFLRDFSWSAKLVCDCGTALESLRPIVVLTLYFVKGATKTYEFTEKEKQSNRNLITSEMYSTLSPGYIAKSITIMLSSSTLLYGFIDYYITGNEIFQQKQFMLLLHCILRPELIAQFNIYLAKYHILPPFSHSYREYSELNCDVMNMQFRNAVGLAAGFDKDAEAIEGLRKSIFDFIEVGTVTPLPQNNDSDSIAKFSSRDEGCIGRGKFKSVGFGNAYLFVRKAYDRNAYVPLCINIGRNAECNRLKTDYNLGAHHFAPFSNYLVVNFGSQAGLKTVNDMEVALQGIASAVNQIIEISESLPKILVKILRDLPITHLEIIIKIALNKQYNINGIIISYSTTSHPKNLRTVLEKDGFLNGRLLRNLSKDCIRNVYRSLNIKPELDYWGFPIIGWKLVECLARDGFRNISQVVDADDRK